MKKYILLIKLFVILFTIKSIGQTICLETFNNTLLYQLPNIVKFCTGTDSIKIISIKSDDAEIKFLRGSEFMIYCDKLGDIKVLITCKNYNDSIFNKVYHYKVKHLTIPEILLLNKHNGDTIVIDSLIHFNKLSQENVFLYGFSYYVVSYDIALMRKGRLIYSCSLERNKFENSNELLKKAKEGDILIIYNVLVIIENSINIVNPIQFYLTNSPPI